MTSTATTLRQSRRRLVRELADYATVAERDELAALLEGRGAADSLAATVLRRQARRALFQ